MIPSPLKYLTESFTKYPGVGPRQAQRFAFFVLKQSEQERQNLINALVSLSQVNLCEECYLPKNLKDKKCSVCSVENRLNNLICVIERETDLMNIEKTHSFLGKYIILGDNISPIKDSRFIYERIKTLLNRLLKLPEDEKKEVILALNNTREGNFTTLYIQEVLNKKKFKNLKITQLGRGLASGNELEYLDKDTLQHAFDGRK